jgi:hypothetical protein
VISEPAAAYAPPSPRPCPGCRKPVPTRFCPDCGESPDAARERSAWRFLLGWIDAFFSLDGRFLGSFCTLLVRPGLLTAEYLAGVRRRRLTPMQTVLFANVFLFLAQPLADASVFNTPFSAQVNGQIYSPLAKRWAAAELARNGVAEKEFARRFDRRTDDLSRTLILLLVPLYAAVFAAVRLPQRLGAVEAAAFAAEYVAYAVTYFFCAVFVVFRLAQELDETGRLAARIAPFVGLFGTLAVGAWLIGAFRRL